MDNISVGKAREISVVESYRLSESYINTKYTIKNVHSKDITYGRLNVGFI